MGWFNHQVDYGLEVTTLGITVFTGFPRIIPPAILSKQSFRKNPTPVFTGRKTGQSNRWVVSNIFDFHPEPWGK